MNNKICKKCGLPKPVNKYNKNQSVCKECQQEYRDNHQKEIQEYREKHREKIREKDRIYYYNSKKLINQPEYNKILKAKDCAKRRGLGFNLRYKIIVNEPFVFHHVNKNDVVAIPRWLHELYSTNAIELSGHRFMISQVVKQLYNRKSYLLKKEEN